MNRASVLYTHGRQRGGGAESRRVARIVADLTEERDTAAASGLGRRQSADVGRRRGVCLGEVGEQHC